MQEDTTPKETCGRLLIVDDDGTRARTHARLFRQRGHRSAPAGSGKGALALLTERAFDLVLSELHMPGMDGLELLERTRDLDLELPFVLLADHGTIDQAVEAVKGGATDFLTRPLEASQLIATVESHLEAHLLGRELARLRADPVPGLIGPSPLLGEVKELVRAASQTTCPVLVVGSSGTGKELVAKGIHHGSARRAGPFVPVNCGALAEGLIESELFGVVKGAYTGAGEARAGLFDAADGGTLFLDEIGEMPPAAQVKLLRAIQEGAVRPVGGTRERPVNVRVVAATNQPPDEAMADGRLRADLYFRLSALLIWLPCLCIRPEDVGPIAEAYLRHHRELHGEGPEAITREALRRLRAYPWPGNVRELQNALEVACILADDARTLELGHLPETVRSGKPVAPGPTCKAAIPHSLSFMGLKEGEEYLIRAALARARGNKSEAARLLGISRPLLYKRMQRHGIPLSQRPEAPHRGRRRGATPCEGSAPPPRGT